jgi:hypothetical protein
MILIPTGPGYCYFNTYIYCFEEYTCIEQKVLTAVFSSPV